MWFAASHSRWSARTRTGSHPAALRRWSGSRSPRASSSPCRLATKAGPLDLNQCVLGSVSNGLRWRCRWIPHVGLYQFFLFLYTLVLLFVILMGWIHKNRIQTVSCMNGKRVHSVPLNGDLDQNNAHTLVSAQLWGTQKTHILILCFIFRQPGKNK